MQLLTAAPTQTLTETQFMAQQDYSKIKKLVFFLDKRVGKLYN